MRVIAACYKILTPISVGGEEELKRIEQVGRTCYKSEDKTGDGTAEEFIARLIERGHEAMVEHSQLSVRFIVDRGVSHELVRHRIASFAQESTRYCNYSKKKFGNELTFIKPCWLGDETEHAYHLWDGAMRMSEDKYFALLAQGWSPQQARSVLPNSLKTEVVMTANYREWRAFFKLRTAKAAHPQMREVTIPLLKELQGKIPVVFDDIIPEV